MKKFQEPPFKQNAIALGFTIGVHAIAIVGLLFLGLSKPPEEPKKLKTVLVRPEDLPQPLTQVEQETTAENEAAEVQSPVVDKSLAENIPVIPPIPSAQQLAAEKLKKAEQAQQEKLAEQRRKTDEATRAQQVEQQRKLAEVQAQKQRADAEAKRQAESKAKTEADAKRKAERNAKAEAEARQKAEQDAKLRQQKAAENAKLQAQQDAKRKAEATAKAKAEADAKRKADADAKAKADADAKRKAEANAKAKADADAKRKAEADAKAKVEADAKRKAEAEADAKAAAAKKAEQEAAQKKAESKKIASTAKRDFENKIKRAWNIPLSSSGQKATARVTLNDSGAVMSVIVNSSDPDMKASIEAAVRAAAPYPMPDDPDARREARSFTSSFTAK